MRPWHTVSAKRSKTMRRHFPTTRDNGCNIRRLVGCVMVSWGCTCVVRQATGRLSAISPQNISTGFASLGRPTCGFMTSNIRKYRRGDAEWRVDPFLEAIRQDLRARRYHPRPVLRVYLPKPDGEQRPLGLPTVRDRVVQQACKLV